MTDKKFDFNSVGKRLPYKQIDSYFENITAETLALAKKRNNKRLLLRRAFSVAASIIVLFSVSLLYFNNSSKKEVSIDELITQMSDNDLNTLMSLSENDDLLNENYE